MPHKYEKSSDVLYDGLCVDQNPANKARRVPASVFTHDQVDGSCDHD